MKIQQVKLFKSVDSEMADMERQINRWMRKSGATILSVSGNLAAQPSSGGPMSTFSVSDILIIVTYEIDYPAKPAAS